MNATPFFRAAVSHRLRAAAAALLAMWLTCAVAQPDTDNAVRSCYTATHVQAPAQPYDKLVYVLLDQTVSLDDTLRKSALDNARRLVQPGTKFVVAEFSAFSQGRYLNVLKTGVVEPPLDESRVGSTPIRATKALSECLALQLRFARTLVDASVGEVLEKASSSLDQSDILFALQSVGKSIASDLAKDKIAFAVTDGLENSSISSFYNKGGIRTLDAKAEMAKVKQAGLLADFGGAKVYVLGGALLPSSTTGSRAARDGYRDTRTLLNLKSFWTSYFASSQATLVEFGEPALIEPVRY